MVDLNKIIGWGLTRYRIAKMSKKHKCYFERRGARMCKECCDFCVFCGEKVCRNKWREHMQVKHVVLSESPVDKNGNWKELNIILKEEGLPSSTN